jgi:hypothetical protein
MPGPPRFDRRVLVIPPGGAVPYDADDWLGALVMVGDGAVELIGVSGARRGFAAGAVLFLDGVPLRALANPGEEPAVLVILCR